MILDLGCDRGAADLTLAATRSQQTLQGRDAGGAANTTGVRVQRYEKKLKERMITDER